MEEIQTLAELLLRGKKERVRYYFLQEWQEWEVFGCLR